MNSLIILLFFSNTLFFFCLFVFSKKIKCFQLPEHLQSLLFTVVYLSEGLIPLLIIKNNLYYEKYFTLHCDNKYWKNMENEMYMNL